MKIDHNPQLPNGFSCTSINCGLKAKENDLSLFLSAKPANAAAVFTKNLFPGAPITVGREIIKRGQLQAVVVNSKVSNVGTGQQGIDNVYRMAKAAATECNIDPADVLVSSTGVIAKQLPIELVENGIKGIADSLQADPMVGARGIMTTDTHPKALSASVGDAKVCIVAKGSGMIEPNMATMLVYIFTDAEISADALDKMLRVSVNQSFNMLSVDSDTSTSDTCAILANGLAGTVDEAEFQETLTHLCVEMTKILAIDGEGATKLLTITIEHAANDKEAVYIAKAVVNSPLIKTMAYGADPNIGRILMAVGKCVHCTVIPEKIGITINGTKVFQDLEKTDYNEDEIRTILGGKSVEITIDLAVGNAKATTYGCDLTEGYIEENAAYYSS